MTKFISLILFFTLCNSALGQNNSINQSDLIDCWKYYPEESKFFPYMTVYRSCEYNSFPSKKIIKGRYKISFSANGKCSYLTIGTTDINAMKPGNWILNSSTNQLEIFDLEINSIGKYKIVSLEDKLLGIEKN